MSSAKLMVARGTILQLVLGSVYAWSFFQKPLVEEFGWSNQQVALTFALSIFFLGLAAALGGQLLPQTGPRKLAVTGVLLYVAGWELGAYALATQQLWLLQIGFGVIGGVGLGLGYVTPVATVAKWFSVRKGLATGTVIMGFGLGALLLSKFLAPFFLALSGQNYALTFACTGLVCAVLALPAALGLRNPDNATPDKSQKVPWPDIRRAVFSAQFTMLWGLFFCNITAGIMLIGFQSPLLQDLLLTNDAAANPATLATAGATLIAASSIFNGVGRFFWGAVSDIVGRGKTFSAITLSQCFAFATLPFVSNPWGFAALVCYVLLCYDGGFGVMPSAIAHNFGNTLMAPVYGAVLTAWSAAGIAGPLFAAFAKDTMGAQAAASTTFAAGGVMLATGFFFSLRIK